VVTLLAISTTTFAYFKSTDRVIDEYEDAGTKAMAEDNFTLARICYGKLVQLQGDRPELLYNLALAENGVGDKQRALELMEVLAPDDKAGSMWRAQLWKGRHYLAMDPATDVSLGNAAVNFYRVMSRERNTGDRKIPDEATQEAAAGLYDIYMKTGQSGLAQQFLERARFKKPELKIIYLRSLAATNRDEALRQLPLLLDEYKELLAKDPSNIQIRLALAETYRIQNDYAAAEKVLSDGLALNPKEADAKELSIGLANLFTIQLRSLTLQKKLNGAEQLRLVRKVLEQDPANVYILSQLYEMAEGNDADAAREARKLWGEMMTKGKPTEVAPIFQMVQGNYWFSHNVKNKARSFLEQAFKLNTKNLQIANNYAWMIATTEPYELDHALQIINEVIKAAPAEVQFYDTRGQILMRMGRYEEALVDLEMSLRATPTSRTVHRALENCYRNLGMTDIADEHARITDRITDEIAKRRMQQANQTNFETEDPPAETQ
jgi:tetratricopeptide (TPR) repeat protein